MNDGANEGARMLTVERRDDGIAVVWLDSPRRTTNAMHEAFGEELAARLGELGADTRGLVFASRKPGSFLEGPDVEMLHRYLQARHRREQELEGLSRRAQGWMERIASLEVPTAAAIDGVCTGPGLELALACQLRLASSERHTRLGAVDVRLGLLPSAGGTQRLPRVIHVTDALRLLTTGDLVDALEAHRLGLVDELVPGSILVDVAADRLIENSHSDEESIRERLRSWMKEGTPLGRASVLRAARALTEEPGHPRLPAPPRIVDVVRIGLEDGLAAGLEAEAVAFGELGATEEARELLRFRLLEHAAQHAPIELEAEPRVVDRVGIVGAGSIGAGIAYLFSRHAGLPVRLQDVEDASLRRALRATAERLERDVEVDAIDELERARALHRVSPTRDLRGFEACRVVIEAVPEALELKREVLRGVEACGPEDLIFASTTASLPISEIAEASARPEAVIGMHYLSPLERMPLLELVVTRRTEPEVLATAVALGRRQGRTVIVVRDGPGFYTTRIFVAYMQEALRMLERGGEIAHIDHALEAWGFTIGPLKLLDELGIDSVERVTRVLHDRLGARWEPPGLLARMVELGRRGRENGAGFYRYVEGERAGPAPWSYLAMARDAEPGAETEAPRTIAERCALRMVDEAVRCHGEGILRSRDDGDVGAVLGLGFPPFRGGPFRLVEREGPRAVLARMEELGLEVGASLRAWAEDGEPRRAPWGRAYEVGRV